MIGVEGRLQNPGERVDLHNDSNPDLLCISQSASLTFILPRFKSRMKATSGLLDEIDSKDIGEKVKVEVGEETNEPTLMK